MVYGAGGAAAAAAAAIAQATKASGAIVKMNPDQFQKILKKGEKMVVVVSQSGIFTKKHNYLTSYRGLFFYTSSEQPLSLPGSVETITAEKIWIPG